MTNPEINVHNQTEKQSPKPEKVPTAKEKAATVMANMDRAITQLENIKKKFNQEKYTIPPELNRLLTEMETTRSSLVYLQNNQNYEKMLAQYQEGLDRGITYKQFTAQHNMETLLKDVIAETTPLKIITEYTVQAGDSPWTLAKNLKKSEPYLQKFRITDILEAMNYVNKGGPAMKSGKLRLVPGIKIRLPLTTQKKVLDRYLIQHPLTKGKIYNKSFTQGEKFIAQGKTFTATSEGPVTEVTETVE